MKYGPQTAVVEAVIERAGRLTPQEARDLADAWVATGNTSAWVAAYVATWFAAGDVASGAAYTAAKVAREAVYIAIATDTTADAARNASYTAADAALTAAVAHLKGRQGLTHERLKTLARPWRQVIVDVDPLEGIGDG